MSDIPSAAFTEWDASPLPRWVKGLVLTDPARIAAEEAARSRHYLTLM